jgi:Right handed beta helix region
MRKITWAFVLFAALLWVCPQPAHAQATRTWVSGVGDDANPCSRTAPCKTFAGALGKTVAGGEIDTMDPGGFGAVTITEALTLAQEGTGEGGILVAGTNAITVSAGAGDVVILRGLQLDGGAVGSGSPAGVQFSSGAALMVQNCAIRNFTGSPGYGIDFAPTGASSLYVSDTVVSTNGGGGILIAPAGGTAKASLTRVNLVNNAFGVKADGASGKVNLTIFDSVASSNVGAGFWASGNASVNIKHSISTHNGPGLEASGANAKLRVGDSSVTGNGTGAVIASGATMSSYSNNQIDDNNAPGATIPTIPLK